MRLMSATRPIPEMLDDAATDTGLRQQLEHATAIREFASRELALRDNQSYRSYADLGRPFVVWNVFAAPELSVDPEKWCLFFVGCVNYRGYFDRDEAEREDRAPEHRPGAVDEAGQRRHVDRRLDQQDARGQRQDRADLDEGRQVVARREQQPDRQRRGGIAVHDDGDRQGQGEQRGIKSDK